MKEINNFRKLLIIFSLNGILIMMGFLAITGTINITGLAVSDLGDYKLYILNANKGKDVTFIIPINNQEGIINEAYAEITIFDNSGVEITKLTTNKIILNEYETNDIRATWFESGYDDNYQAQILIFNDNQSYSFSKQFKLDDEIITFQSVVINEFTLGETVNVSVILENHLSTKLENVSVSILIQDNELNTVSEITSETKSIEPLSIEQLRLFWDTNGINSGTYNAQMIINYNEDFIDRDLIINVEQDSFNIVGIGYSISSNSNQESEQNLFLVYFIIGLLLLTNIVWVIYYLRSKSKK